MIVVIDRTNCVSCGTCSDTCPDLFQPNPDDSFSQIVELYRVDGDIAKGKPSEALEPCARDAVDLCPVQIIRIEET
jgi:ferredoxin